MDDGRAYQVFLTASAAGAKVPGLLDDPFPILAGVAVPGAVPWACDGKAAKVLEQQWWCAHREQLHQLAAEVAELQTGLAREQTRAQDLRDELARLENLVKALTGERDVDHETLADLRQELAARQTFIDALSGRVIRGDEAVQQLEARLASITGSKGWRLLLLLWRLRAWLAPRGSRRERCGRGCLRLLRRLRSMELRAHRRPPAAPPPPVWTGPPPEPGAEPEPEAASRPGPEYDVFCLPASPWHSWPGRGHQLMRQFARHGHRVFYASPCFHRIPVATLQEVEPRVFDLGLPAADDVESIVHALESLRCRERVVSAVLVVQSPFWRPLADEVRRRIGWPVVCDGSQEAGPHFADGDEFESPDLVIATSDARGAEAQANGRRSLLLPNASPLGALGRTAPVPEISRRGPMIGTYGDLDTAFDQDLLAELAALRPGWRFEIVGTAGAADVGRLEHAPNAAVLGPRRFEELPRLVADWACCVFPWRPAALPDAGVPVQVYEMLAAGKPIVAADLPCLRPLAEQGLVTLASEPAGFARAVEACLGQDGPAAVARRRAFARQNTWEHRYAPLDRAVRDLFPRVAVVIVSYNNPACLRRCLESLWAKTAHPNFTVVVVDNGSQPDVADYLTACARREPRLQALLNGQNLGFACANNQGIEAAGACDYVVLLNNDTVVTRGWLTTLLRHLDDPTVGLVGPVTNAIGNEARIAVDYQRLEDMDRFAQRYTRLHAGESFDITMLAMFCVGVRKSVLDEVGPLDERFQVGMFEDDDYSLRVRRAGYRVVCAEDVFVHHEGSASFGKLGGERYRQIFEENRRKFEAKWGIKWQSHQYRPSLRALPKSA